MSETSEAKLSLKVEFELDSSDGGMLLRIPETGQVLLLNDSSHLLLTKLQQGAGRSQIIAALVESFGADEEVVRGDVERCLLDLVRLGVVEDARF